MNAFYLTRFPVKVPQVLIVYLPLVLKLIYFNFIYLSCAGFRTATGNSITYLFKIFKHSKSLYLP